MPRRIFNLLFALLFGVALIPSYASESFKDSNRSYTEMLQSGNVRMAVPYEQIVFVQSKNQIIGAAPDISKYLGIFLSKKYNQKITVSIFPFPENKLIDAIDNGDADFAITYNPSNDPKSETRKHIRYPHPYPEENLIVSKSGLASVNDLLELSGEVVSVSRLKDIEALNEANKTLIRDGKKPIQIYQDKYALDDEDLLQMLNGDLIPYAYVAKWKAMLWQPVYTGIQINEKTISPKGSPVGLVVNLKNKALAEDVMSFIASPELKQALDSFRKKESAIRKNALKNPFSPLEWKRFGEMSVYFKKYANQNQLDPLFLAGLAFQESLLDQAAVSPVGAIGVMQLMPSTGESLNVGDIHQLEPNIHAGAKYISSLIYALSIEGDLLDIERSFFTVAAYNAGPNNIRKARLLASEMGFDPNKWFENVEMVSAKLFGNQTFLYVRNVYKYYVAYHLRTHNNSTIAKEFIPEELLK